jgi:hypothetical protein
VLAEVKNSYKVKADNVLFLPFKTGMHSKNNKLFTHQTPMQKLVFIPSTLRTMFATLPSLQLDSWINPTNRKTFGTVVLPSQCVLSELIRFVNATPWVTIEQGARIILDRERYNRDIEDLKNLINNTTEEQKKQLAQGIKQQSAADMGSWERKIDRLHRYVSKPFFFFKPLCRWRDEKFGKKRQ